MRKLELGGGSVTDNSTIRLEIPAQQIGYADAQIDDYGSKKRAQYPWSVGSQIRLEARFSHNTGELLGTAGFGFWNAPFSDPTLPFPALPKVAWFFYGSEPTNLPLSERGPGRGWHVATLDATKSSALAMIPASPILLILNQIARIRRYTWPVIRKAFGMSFALADCDMRTWNRYEIDWSRYLCRFSVNGKTVLKTPFSPKGPLAFVCWIDNQYLVATNTGRIKWGTVQCENAQWLEVSGLEISNKS